MKSSLTKEKTPSGEVQTGGEIIVEIAKIINSNRDKVQLELKGLNIKGHKSWSGKLKPLFVEIYTNPGAGYELVYKTEVKRLLTLLSHEVFGRIVHFRILGG